MDNEPYIKSVEPVKNKDVTTLDETLDSKYGERGTLEREVSEQKFEAFRLNVVSERSKLKTP